MTGRLDNARVGYFTNPLLSYSDGQQRVSKQQFITRWRLEPKPEDRERYLRGELVEPAKPIIFYIETLLRIVGVSISNKALKTGRWHLNVPDSRMPLSPKKSPTA